MLKNCKHCKQTDHSRITSHLCPKNPNYKVSAMYKKILKSLFKYIFSI